MHSEDVDSLGGTAPRGSWEMMISIEDLQRFEAAM